MARRSETESESESDDIESPAVYSCLHQVVLYVAAALLVYVDDQTTNLRTYPSQKGSRIDAGGMFLKEPSGDAA